MTKRDVIHVSDTALPLTVLIRTVLFGVAVSFGFTLAVFLLFAVLITYTGFPEGAIGTVVLLTTVFAAQLSGIFPARCASSKGWLKGAVGGSCYILTMYLIGAIAFSGPSFDKQALLLLFIGFIAGGIGGIIGINVFKN